LLVSEHSLASENTPACSIFNELVKLFSTLHVPFSLEIEEMNQHLIAMHCGMAKLIYTWDQ
jgi:hypothetical protein